MDLLNENQYKESSAPKGKKIVLLLLILSIIFTILIIGLIIYISTNRVPEEKLFINGEQKEITQDLFVNDQLGNQYIELKNLVELLGYEFENGEYQKDEVDTSKFYVKNQNLITGFEVGSNRIYKYEEGTNLDYQYYTLNCNIITNENNRIYIGLGDLTKALNCSYSINENKENRIESMEYLATTYQEKLNESGYVVASDQNNQKSFAYGRIIASRDGVWNILNENLEDIGLKYSSIYFDEQNESYIVSNTSGKYGIIAIDGAIKETLKYEDLTILNYENMLYKVKNNNKYGIMKSNGKSLTKLTDIEYDDIGYSENLSNKILYTLIIPELEKNMSKTIVVKKDNKYGLVYLATGDTYLPCDYLDKIYSISDLGETKYMVEIGTRKMELLNYLIERGTYVVDLNQ